MRSTSFIVHRRPATEPSIFPLLFPGLSLSLSLYVYLSLSLPFALALDDKSRRRVTHTSARGECRFVSFAFAPLPVRLFSFTCSSSWRPRGKKKTTSRSPRRIRVREFHFLRAMTLPVARDCLVDFAMIADRVVVDVTLFVGVVSKGLPR